MHSLERHLFAGACLCARRPEFGVQPSDGVIVSVFPSIEGEPSLDKVFRRFPHTLAPLLDYHDRLLRDRSPLTVGERELIAAYVSGLNA